MTQASGDVVLFIHSTGTGPMLWDSVPDAVVGGRRRLLPANLGYPPGPPVARGRVVTAEDDAAQVLGTLREHGAHGRVHVVAHSYGGLVALHLVPALGERLASLFLFEPVLFGGLMRGEASDPAGAEEARQLAAHPWFLTDVERGGRAEWLEMFVDYWNRPGWWSLMYPPMKEACLAVGWKMFQEARSCFFEERPLDAWSIPVPTTIAIGGRTTNASRAISRGLARGRANVEVVEVKGTGHMAPLSHPIKVHETLAQHFARLEATK